MQRSGKRTWITLVILLVCFLAAGYVLQSKQPAAYLDYVSDSPSPTGTKAFYTYVKEEAESVKRWNKPPGKLADGDGRKVLVMIEPQLPPKSEEMEAYEEFMKAGHTLILFKNNPQGMFDIKTNPVTAAEPEEGLVYDRQDISRQAQVSYGSRLQTDQGDDILIYDDAGTMALERPVGKGKLIVSMFPEWLMNRNLLTDDHVPLLVSLFNEAGSDHLLFDEYVHQPQGAAKVMHVYPMWFLLVMFQGALLLILWLWHQGKRFGPIYRPREATVRFSDEGIRALAAWYKRSRLYHDSVAIQADYLKFVLQERWHIPYQEGWSSVSGLIKRSRGRIDQKEIDSFTNGLTEVLNKDRLSKQEYIFWSKQIDRMRKVVEEQ
ncbi:DUF4350 domain-containing protein [Siminovitchia sediminis]|uniref:DUF4350 domain-containing protein n=1 Tax=Siminovitchia sediminis TaxID=1274353 RepID=A0ABW4KG83_9BACI